MALDINELQRVAQGDTISFQNPLVEEYVPLITDALRKGGWDSGIDSARRGAVVSLSKVIQGFINQYRQLPGKQYTIPSDQEIRDFIGNVFVGENPVKIVTGQLGANEIGINLAKPYLQEIEDLRSIREQEKQSVINAEAQRQALENTARQQADLQQEALKQYIAEQERGAADTLKEQLGEQIRRQTNEGAQLGRLTQPAQQENVNRATSAFGGDLAKAIGQIRSGGLQSQLAGRESLMDRLQRAGEFSTSAGQQQQQLTLQKKLGLEGLSQQNKSLLEQIRQFDIGTRQSQADRDLAMRLGQMQAEAAEPGILDYVGTALGGVGAIGGLAGGIGGLMGAFKKK